MYRSDFYCWADMREAFREWEGRVFCIFGSGESV